MTRQDGISELWLNCNDRETEGDWKCEWQESSSFFSWIHGQPDNFQNKEDCAAIHTDGLWNDLPCDVARRALCAYRVPQTRHCKYTILAEVDPSRLPSHCLVGHVIREFAVVSAVRCASACAREPRCRSVNIVTTSPGNMVCQLNDANHLDGSAQFQEGEFFCKYYSHSSV